MPKTPTAKKWTILVYMAGDNDLDPEGALDIKEMKSVGSTDAINVVVQFDRAKGHTARRYFIRKGGTVAGDAVLNVGKVNTGDPACLVDFITWGAAHYPADRYLLVLWNHGQGWDDTDVYADERYRSLRRLASKPVRHALFHAPVRRTIENARKSKLCRAILLDDNAKDFLDNKELGKVLASTKRLLGRKLDILGMDACLMSMAEVGYQIRNYAAYTVGSEQTEPGAGWPYNAILSALAKKPSLTPQELGELIVAKYLASYKSSEEGGVTQAVCDLSKSDDLAASVTALAAALTASLKKNEGRQRILSVRSRVQSYDNPDNIDIVDLCTLLLTSGAGNHVASACKKVIAATGNHYVIKQGSKGNEVKHSNGVAIYFPVLSISPLYAGLEFCKKTGWDMFLAAYIKSVRSR
jgi:hypothetical protein